MPREGLSEHSAAALCYLLGPVTGAFFLTVSPYNRSFIVRLHAWQSIGFSGLFGLLYLVLIGLTLALPWLLVGVILLLLAVLGLGFVLLYFLLITHTMTGKKMLLPWIGPAAERLARQ